MCSVKLTGAIFILFLIDKNLIFSDGPRGLILQLILFSVLTGFPEPQCLESLKSESNELIKTFGFFFVFHFTLPLALCLVA